MQGGAASAVGAKARTAGAMARASGAAWTAALRTWLATVVVGGETLRKDLPWKPLRGVGSTQPWISKWSGTVGLDDECVDRGSGHTGKPA